MASKPKPSLSVWLIAQRKAHGETVEDVARVVDRSDATIRGWEAGRPPSADDPSIVVLERHWGSEAPHETLGENFPTLLVSMERQTAAIEAQVNALRELTLTLIPLVEAATVRETRVEEVEGELKALRALVQSLHLPPDGAERSERLAPRGTTG